MPPRGFCFVSCFSVGHFLHCIFYFQRVRGPSEFLHCFSLRNTFQHWIINWSYIIENFFKVLTKDLTCLSIWLGQCTIFLQQFWLSGCSIMTCESSSNDSHCSPWIERTSVFKFFTRHLKPMLFCHCYCHFHLFARPPQFLQCSGTAWVGTWTVKLPHCIVVCTNCIK